MRVVLAGDRNRNESKDHALVYSIIDELKDLYPTLIVVVASCDKGVGRIVRSRNLDPHIPSKFEFDMIELQMRHYLKQELPRTHFTACWNSLNDTLLGLGDEFHLLTGEYPRGAIFDLLRKVKDGHRPFSVYKPSEGNCGFKKASFDPMSTPLPVSTESQYGRRVGDVIEEQES